jgi:hypothetical protein
MQKYRLYLGVMGIFLMLASLSWGQSAAGSVQGVVTDVTGALIPNAKVTLHNAVSGYSKTAVTGGKGEYSFKNVPFNHYRIAASAAGFAAGTAELELRSAAPLTQNFSLDVASNSTTVQVNAEAEEVLTANPQTHTTLDSSLLKTLPVTDGSSALSSVIEEATPGVTSDSNGLFHPQGEHSDTSYSIDNQPVTDQQSKVFSNQVAMSTIESMEVISGVAPAEYGDKASMVIETVTKSGLSSDGPHGSVESSYGSFGSSTQGLTLSDGNNKLGEFLAIDGMESGRYLDSPEFRPIHDHGNSESAFNRFDYQITPQDALHLNLSLARSWFQTPNDYDQQAAGQDQRQMQRSFNIAPGYTHLFGSKTLLSANAFVRQDRISYFPSHNIMDDQPATLSQQRRLTNAGVKTDVAFSSGANSLKAGAQFTHTFLSENFHTGITDNLYNSPCVDADGAAVAAAGVTDPSQCAAGGYEANTNFQSGLLAYDLTRGGELFAFRGRTDIKQEAVYVQDSLALKNLTVNGGVRFDNYNGMSRSHGVQPRAGASYVFKKTKTVLRASYGRFFLTPYNENLVLSSSTGTGGLAGATGAYGDQPLVAGRRNHFETGLQQGITSHILVDASYFWKFTDDDFDFDVFLNTPLAFPIQWRKSKIDGVSVRVNLAETHRISAYSVFGHTRARFFGPETGGLIFNSPVDTGAFRIDHDQNFEQNTHLQYRLGKRLPWVGINWDYESGMVAGAVPDFATALTLTGDQQAQIGLYCGNTYATVSTPLRTCNAANYGATRVKIPTAGTENDDSNPPRIAPRNLFDLAIGLDNLLKGDKRKLSLQFTAVNLTNKVALFNFLSTFSGTHFVAPRSFTLELGYHF